MITYIFKKDITIRARKHELGYIVNVSGPCYIFAYGYNKGWGKLEAVKEGFKQAKLILKNGYLKH